MADTALAELEWRPIESAPKDGTLLLLLLAHNDEGEFATATENEIEWRTIGFNSFENDGEDKWLYAGWCWDHDHFTAGCGGAPIKWMPLPAAPQLPKDKEE